MTIPGFDSAQAAYDAQLPPDLDDEDCEDCEDEDEDYEEERLRSRDYDAWANL